MKESKRNVMIIAEAGVNHNGDIALAKQLVDANVKCMITLGKETGCSY